MTTPLDITDFVYNTGTLTIAPGATTAVFTGSSLSANIKDGDYLFAGGSLAVIETVTDDTNAELFTEWAGSDVTDGPYVILKSSLLRYHTALIGYDSATFLAMLDGLTVFYVVTGDEPDPSIGEEGQFAIKTNAGAWVQWIKTGGVWDLQATPVGVAWRGAWDSGTAYAINDAVQRLGSTYISKSANTNAPPESSTSDWDLSSAKGDAGRDGGVIAIPYTYSSTTSDSDPGDGVIRIGPGASQKAATIWRADVLDVDGKDWTGTLADLAASTSAVKCAARLYKKSDQTARIVGNVTAFATPTGYRNLTFVATSGDDNPFTNGDAVILVLDRTGDKGDQGIQGVKGMTNRGTWASVTAYVTDDVVTKDGSSYIAIAGSTNKDPASEPTFWSVLAAKGATGATGSTGTTGSTGATGSTGPTGPGFTWRGIYSSATAYAVNDVVGYSGKAYINIQAGTNQQPNTATAYWTLYIDTPGIVDSHTVSGIASNYTAATGDRGTMLRCTATLTLALTAAATLTNGWYCYVKADGAVVTIDPDSSETIDGATTQTLASGSAIILFCTGTGFITFSTSSGGGSLSVINENIQTADYTTLASDLGKRVLMNSTSAHTITLLAAATAGAGFAFFVRNINTGLLTVDANSSETIDGDLTFVLDKDEEALLSCTGTGWRKSLYRSEGHLEPETDVATGSTMDIGATNTERVRATGTTGVTSFGSRAYKRRVIRFTGQVTVTHNATSLFLPGEANLTFDANDVIEAISDASGNWRVVDIQKNLAPARGKLTSNRTYYVRTDGNNANTGLANTSGGAFLTVQKAVDVVAALDISIYSVTIQVGDGTYTGTIAVSGPWVGSGTVSIVGNLTTPGNVILNPSGGTCFNVANCGSLTIAGGFETRGNVGVASQSGSTVLITGAMRYGTTTAYQIFANGGAILIVSNYSIVGGGIYHIYAAAGGRIFGTSLTITLTGTPAFTSFAVAGQPGAYLEYYLNTFSGSATGQRYNASAGGMINVNAAGTTYLPGSTSGAGTNFGTSPYGLYQ